MKRKKSGGGGANWMDTYGDMVTLLLCFFVLLYSISTVDQAKWVNLVKSMNPDAKEVSQVVQDPNIDPGDEEVPGSVQSDQAFDQLYEGLTKEMEELGVAEDVAIHKGKDYEFITFNNKVFFDGDSPVLRPEGKEVLDGFCRATGQASEYIKEIRVMGHTTQEDPNKQNDVAVDRLLSADRAANVVTYIQAHNIIEPSKLVHEGYGQFHPIATFENEEGRKKNRRAEILILKDGGTLKTLQEYYDEIYGEGVV